MGFRQFAVPAAFGAPMARSLTICVLLLAALAAPVHAQEVTEIFRVPTVDGEEISVEVRRPDGVRVPVLLTYSPYNTLSEPNPTGDSLGNVYVPQGYARAVADVLGTRNSTGCWDYGGPREQQSGVDVVNWLSAQPWSTGKVAMVGTSYDGTTANMVAAAGERAPGLAAIVPTAAISRWYGYAFTRGVRHAGNSQEPTDEGLDTPLAFDFGFAKIPPTDPNAIPGFLQGRLRPCDEAEHTDHAYSRQPDYDDFWLERDYRKDASSIRVPTLVVHGWQDYSVHQEEGTALYEAIDRAPWRGLIVWQAPRAGIPDASADYVNKFFNHFLLGHQNGFEREPRVFSQPRDTAGSAGELTALASWPPPRTGDVELKLSRGDDGGKLGGPVAGGPASYTDTSTNTEEAEARNLTREAQWLAYTSDPLETDVRIAGTAALDIKIAASRAHGHLTPTLFDIEESGRPTPISRGFLNLRYRDGLAKGADMAPGRPTQVVATFKPQDWIVRKGHRIAVAIASSNTIWALPDDPGVTVEVQDGRLLLPVVGAGKDPVVPGATQPTTTLPTARAARKLLELTLRRAGRRRLRGKVAAPAGARVVVHLLRGKRAVGKRTVVARRGRAAVTFRVRKGGRYRLVGTIRTREGLVRKVSRYVRVR